MEKNQNVIYSGWKMNGFAMLFIVLLSWVGGPFLAIYGGINFPTPYEVVAIVSGSIIFLWAIIASCGFLMLEPNEARVLLFFGKYRGNFVQSGYWWINPFMSKKHISLRARNLNAEPIKVNDKQGNPILIGLVLVWKIRENEIYKAVFDIDTPIATGEISVTSSRASNCSMDLKDLE